MTYNLSKANCIRRRTEKLKSIGLCISCGRNEKYGNKIRCKYCLEKNKHRKKKKFKSVDEMLNDLSVFSLK